MDSVPTNAVFARQIGVTFPLLSDFFRKVSTEYGILNVKHGFADRTSFVVNKQGVITHIDRNQEALDPSSAQQACSLMAHREAEQKK